MVSKDVLNYEACQNGFENNEHFNDSILTLL